MPLPLREALDQLAAGAFIAAGLDEAAARAAGVVVPSQRPELGQFQCNGAMAAGKKLGRPPRAVAEAVVAELARHTDIVRDVTIAGPGFINLSVADAYLAGNVQSMTDDARLGIAAASPAKRVVVDYGGPNVAKPMHVGHLRSSIIGDSVKRLFRWMGHDVVGDIHLGDWGTQMGMLICAVQREQPALPYFDAAYSGPYPAESPVTLADLQRLYPAASALCKENEDEEKKAQQATVELQSGRPGYRALWQHFWRISVDELKEDFARLGIEFDYWYGESHYHDRIGPMVERMKSAGHAVVDEGALIIPVARPDDKKEVPPLMLLKRDGAANYATSDLATIEQRVADMHADLVLYVVDKRQSLHFEQVFRASRLTGIAPERVGLEHLAYGTMNGSDGRPFKTRAGGVMRLKDLIEMMTTEAAARMNEGELAKDYPEAERVEIARRVGLGSLKYADLMNVRAADYVFDIARFTRFEGRTGAYLLMAAVRIQSILRKATEAGFAPGPILPPRVEQERALMLEVTRLSEALRNAVDERAPHHLCAYAYELAAAFSSFYTACHIMSEPDAARRASWLGLSSLVLRELRLLLDLLGIEVPERM